MQKGSPQTIRIGFSGTHVFCAVPRRPLCQDPPLARVAAAASAEFAIDDSVLQLAPVSDEALTAAWPWRMRVLGEPLELVE